MSLNVLSHWTLGLHITFHPSDQTSTPYDAPIAPHLIQGFNGSSTNALGIGNIDLSIGSGHTLLLKDVLYVPSCNVCLVSVKCLGWNSYDLIGFTPNNCYVSFKKKIIVQGFISDRTGLYMLHCNSALVTHLKPPGSHTKSTPTTALYTQCVPDLETWHRQLRHCNIPTIIDMAHKKLVKGMTINLSSSLPKCDPCVLGKQTQIPVLKRRKGKQAKEPLQRVYVDLCGPMPADFKSGCLYVMNMIDDYSGYIWSFPLKHKSNAITVLWLWHRAVENQSRHKLKILVTNNGKLISNAMSEWCSEHGIDHQTTAPYTSAHNGCATVAYLTNFCASSEIKGQIPHELWSCFIKPLSWNQVLRICPYSDEQPQNILPLHPLHTNWVRPPF